MSAQSPISTRVAGVILSAGRSSRMGTPKAMLHLAGRTMLEGLIAVYLESKLSPVVVVAQGEVLRSAMELETVEVVAGDPSAPMVDSYARGIDAVMDRASAAVMQPVDAPFTTPAMIAALLAGDLRVPRVLCHEGRPGHPVLVPTSIFDELEERPQGGLRAVLANRDVELVEWADARVLADLDTPADVRRWRTALEDALH